MITLKSPTELEVMRQGGAILREVLDLLTAEIKPGVMTIDLDRLAHDELTRRGTKPAFLGLYGFPGSVCTSINEQIVHGIPDRRRLVEGDIISLDCGLIFEDFYLDSARTVPVGRVDEEAQRLIQVATDALEIGIAHLTPGKRLGDVAAAIQQHVENAGFAVVREYTGHGIGRKLHEDPKIPNHGRPGIGKRWQAGMTVCIEPMVNAGTHQTRTLEDQWTVVTADGRRSAHMEHTVAITEAGPLVLT
jgi:methionyl aminopeptidase